MADDILKWIRFAIELEVKGLDFYKECREKSTHPRVIELFDFLVKAETAHKRSLTELLEAYSKGDKEKMKKSVRDFMEIHIEVPVFTKKDRQEFKEHDRELSKAFNLARKMEDKGRELYLDMAEKESDPEIKRFFEKIAKDEAVHKREITDLGFFVFGFMPSDETIPEKDGSRTPKPV